MGKLKFFPKSIDIEHMFCYNADSQEKLKGGDTMTAYGKTNRRHNRRFAVKSRRMANFSRSLLIFLVVCAALAVVTVGIKAGVRASCAVAGRDVIPYSLSSVIM